VNSASLRFKQATAGGVTIEVAGQTITFDQEKVRAIYFGSSPAPGQPAAQPAVIFQKHSATEPASFSESFPR
jgi:hypothetical protein